MRLLSIIKCSNCCKSNNNGDSIFSPAHGNINFNLHKGLPHNMTHPAMQPTNANTNKKKERKQTPTTATKTISN